MSLKDLTWVHCTQNVNYDINKNETILNRLLYQIVKSIEITVWYNERLRNDHTLPPYAIFFHKMNLLQHLEIICFIILRFFKKKFGHHFFRPYSCNTLTQTHMHFMMLVLASYRVVKESRTQLTFRTKLRNMWIKSQPLSVFHAYLCVIYI